MHHSIFTTWIFALTLAGLAACGAEGPAPSDESGSGKGGADAKSQGGASADGGGTAAPDDDDGGQSSGSGSASSGSGGDDGGEDPPTCSIMSSNTPCKSCLEENCCMVVHACLDEDLLGCVSCLDCYLSGDGPDCCDESVGKNDWLAECIAFNCQDAC